MRFLTRISAAAMLAGSLAPFASAQGVIDDAYGRGVHAYFAGDYTRALRWLDEAIEAGSQDPRVFYYHGLTQIAQSGGTFEAGLPDLEKAALLEVEGGRVVNVYRALERIQGYTRQRIEDIRLDTFIANRDRLPRPPLEPTTPVPLDSLTDPYGDDAGLTTGEPADMPPITSPATPLPPQATTPFSPATPPDAGAVSPDADPFGGAAPDTDPFGGAAPDADPFGGAAPDADPFGGAAPDADPFGGDAPAAPAGDAPAGDEATNPFGDDPAGGDPFGGDPFGG